MFERFTRPARTVVEAASAYATATASRETRPEHLFRALLEDESCLAARVLVQSGATLGELRAELDANVHRFVDGLDDDDAEALKVIGIDLAEVVRGLDRLDRPSGSDRRGPGRRRPRFSRASKKALELSLREALALRHNYIGTEHLLLGLVRVEDRVVADTLTHFAIERDGLRSAVAEAVRQAG
jgi:ATP-dependent Clp protease ATP-binding subunit ClpA